MLSHQELTSLSLSSVAEVSETLEQSVESFSVENKGSSRDLVTDLEFTIERQLSKALAVSGIAVIGEELSTADSKCPDISWWVDPIDGTSNFVAGLPYYGISVGLVNNKQFEIGTVAFPALKEIYFTYNSTTAFCNGKKLKVQRSSLDNSIVGASFSKKSNISSTEQYKIFGQINDSSRSVMRTGSAALNVCNVAASKFGAAYGFDAKIWDVAGALAVAKASGCEISVRYTSDRTLDYLVSNPECFAVMKTMTGIQ